ncbi:DUF2812 domain-containing protein [Sutcliffiella rhizosphaerae]|uniref:DUF2812 domain-containing protein n=1 Tax=Sutcliffiella rhizosphaerae TaxID=2880967 RepID=A0ABN8A9U2_9BACI|nr:DUF2812 domain-containing protein [Sutcliffiella rhizosphaerae]CAG9621943.1 hypothetical protein BACCIP111883_02734 [Sutcliffiella rhizosphaerae]
MKLKRKILWLELWKIEEQEAWFSYLATKGYVLKQVTKLYAIFAKEQPQNITYKIAVDTTTQKPSDLTISEYKQLSWEYVASRGNLHIYKNGSSNDSFPAINQISSLKKLRKKLKVRTVAILCLSILIIILQTYMMVIEPIKNYTEDAFLSPLFIISIFILVNIQMWSGVKHLGKLIVEADTNNLLVNKAV